MYAKALLISSFAASALAVAAPAITAAPARRDVGDTLGNLGDNIDDLIADATQAAGNAGDNIGDIVSKIGSGASDILGDLGTELGNIGTNLGEFATCASAGLAIITSLPKAPEGVLEAVASAAVTAKPTDNCYGTVIPSSLQSAYSSYETELASWYAQNSDRVSSLVSVCPTIAAEYSDAIDDAVPCATAVAAVGGSGSDSGSGSGSNNGDAGGAASSIRVTGAVAAIAAGAIGAVAFLL